MATFQAQTTPDAKWRPGPALGLSDLVDFRYSTDWRNATNGVTNTTFNNIVPGLNLTPKNVHVWGSFKTGSDPGTFGLLWAQNNSNANYTRVLAGSTFEIWPAGVDDGGSGGDSGEPLLDITLDSAVPSFQIPINGSYEALDVDVQIPKLASGGGGLRLWVNGQNNDADYYYQEGGGYDGQPRSGRGNGAFVGRLEDYSSTSNRISVTLAGDQVWLRSWAASYAASTKLWNQTIAVVHKPGGQTDINALLLGTGGSTNLPAGTRIIVRNPNATHTADGAGGGVPEAPQDGNVYGRKNGAWVVIP